jgi:hypothetical protein
MYLYSRLFHRVTFLPWLSLRGVFHTAPAGTLFCELPRRVERVNFLASLAAHAIVVGALVHLRTLLPLPAWAAWLIVAGAVSLFFVGRRRVVITAVVGVALTGRAMAADDTLGVAQGAACLAVWLAITWESREAWRNWLNKPLNLSAVNVGSAKALRGNVGVLHLFLDTPKRHWRLSDRSGALRMVDEACRWMTAAARRYQTTLQFQHEVVNEARVRYDGLIPTAENDYAGLDDFQTFVASTLESRDRADRRPESDRSADHGVLDNAFLLIHVAAHLGASAYAVPQHRPQTPGALAVEYAVVGAWRNPAIYAHEILHLFGAADYRLSKFDDREEVRHWDSLRESLLRRSIMFDGYPALGHLIVDEQTAQCVGWM